MTNGLDLSPEGSGRQPVVRFAEEPEKWRWNQNGYVVTIPPGPAIRSTPRPESFSARTVGARGSGAPTTGRTRTTGLPSGLT